jgi:hypothetical protein
MAPRLGDEIGIWKLPDSPLSLWLAEYGDYRPEAALDGDVEVDVAVIGGGLVGMATAMQSRSVTDGN